MAEKQIMLTEEGLKKLEVKLEHLKTVRRTQVAERIKQAIEFGDISENSEYEDAKNEQAFIEGEIMTLEKMLRNSQIISDADKNKDEVRLGCTVKIKDIEFDEILEYSIVGSAEADPTEFKISNESPVGQAIIGQKVGKVVKLKPRNKRMSNAFDYIQLSFNKKNLLLEELAFYEKSGDRNIMKFSNQMVNTELSDSLFKNF